MALDSDPHGDADDPVGTEPAGTEPTQTQAVPFNPFDDDEDEDAGTQAVAFNPFDDDEDEDSGSTPSAESGDLESATTDATSTGGRAAMTARTTFPVPRGRVLVPERGAPLVHDRRFGSELVDLPPIVDTEPEDAVLVDPQIPERKRKCWNCGTPLGRESGPHAGPLSGTCPNCGVRYAFVPSLGPGTIVADQYEILGAIAHGGMGWIYVAIDRNVSDRPVVLKGLLNSGDSAAQAVAMAERQFLASVNHPGIVKIYNFVEHVISDERTIGYIVMEYIGGQTLKQLTTTKDAEGRSVPRLLSPEQAMAYVLEVLPAVGYLHSVGLVYNDVKPDNIMVSASDVRLIDMGAVAPIGGHGRLYGTPGFQAPEIVETGPQVATDIYSIGRTLAVLTVDMPMEGGQYLPGLPAVADVPLFVENPSFHLLLARATAVDPGERFASTAEMTTQLLNVLRETVAVHTGVPRPALSTVFTPPRSTFGTELLLGPVDAFFDPDETTFYDPADIAAALPVPLLDTTDPAARVLSSAALSAPRQILESIRAHREGTRTPMLESDETIPHHSLEIDLAEARAYLELDDVDTALGVLGAATKTYGHNWRIEWYLGICALRNDEPELAYERFNETLEAMPGEIGPKLAVAGTAELIGRWLAAGSGDPASVDPEVRRWYEIARHHYQDLWYTDHAIITAAFALARIHLAYGEVEQALVGLDEVPSTSRHYNTALETAVLALVHGRPAATVTHAQIEEAATRLAAIPDTEPRKPRIKLIVLGSALGWVLENQPTEELPPLLGYPFTEFGLRSATEQSLRDLARETRNNRSHRFMLVDLANYVRPATWF
ncbi:MAG TPA: tetratricopeptide repeat protein [Gordonia sp. (in: high G+C Gram-positive bacteria)]|uniref:serine/threonine-protein kinase n=1 Tax=unclassified Gordonia (in: high G+C Gram-positive bacteria) TaxID=2657482 RepID=UPI000FBCFE35|nr:MULTISPECIES: serine/threonine-protein kinase [unclassified Gordonia (in: high G+C Gram-positive bacteria)]RUP41464.1 MAG: serine/threonine protein kinase [Gordonia sp. (in: high G+C Gram-positive bacteria)]HNP57117.1 tetratricopeptide repeat protein [Gordonia sp. (in: high G+C Gram-positive bacteria)]HRC50563.1 tetratricopeptide repeat protein [Gordonia sp. (in: high G+C Gram-positive bacteria)]